MIAVLPAPASSVAGDADSVVVGCPGGQPRAFNRLPDAPPFTARQHARAREALWRDRGGGSALCLTMAAHEWARYDVRRARTLAATGFVRGRWEARRCADPGGGDGGYPATLSAVRSGAASLDRLEEPAEAWRTAVRAAALDPATFRYEIYLAPVCQPAVVRPRAEWPAIEARLRTELLAATAPRP